jgi:hypothetical protein
MTSTQRHTTDLAASARQVGYWIDRGWLRPDARGTGNSYRWSDAEWRIAVVMSRLVVAGLSPEAAHQAARAAGAGGTAEIGPGLVVLVDPPQPVAVAA